MKGIAAILVVLLPITLIVLVLGVKRPPEDELDKQGLALFNAEDYDGAIKVWEEGLKIAPDSVLLLNRIGVALTQKKDFPAARDTFLKAVKIEPDFAQTHFNLGLLYLYMEDETKAIEELQETLRAASWYPETHYHLGLIYEKQGKLDLAAQEYVAELNVNPNCAGAWRRHFILKERQKSQPQVSEAAE
jgi:tetratricopeptide (TPR) repeat protein